jgi:hypothetical protein
MKAKMLAEVSGLSRDRFRHYLTGAKLKNGLNSFPHQHLHPATPGRERTPQ